jgi:hypothetical protein
MAGKHRTPAPEPTTTQTSRPLIAMVAAGVVVLLVLGLAAWWFTRDDDGEVTAQSTSTVSATTPSATETTPSSTPTPTTTPTPTVSRPVTPPPAKPTVRPHTLVVQVTRGHSYVTVRIPGGRTLLSKDMKAGDRASFDQPRLQVVVGNSAVVRFTINGKVRAPGRVGQVETFTVVRK